MVKEAFIEITKKKLDIDGQEKMLEQIDRYYQLKKIILPKNNYKIGDNVKLVKGTLLHGTYKNIEGLKEILTDGLISSWFIDGRISKYPSSVGVWNLQKDYLLKDYINDYSGGTIKYSGLLENNTYSQKIKTEIISYDKMHKINDIIINNPCRIWQMEQTKEARFMPSLNQEQVQIGIIFSAEYTKSLLLGDILDCNYLNDLDVKPFVNELYYHDFIIDRQNKDDFFTNRESAILFGIPANLIEGILVGRKYEQDNTILKEIKELIPNAYICNLDGIIIK